MKREYSMVLELCRFQNPNKEKIKRLFRNAPDYPFILGELLYNRTGAAAYYTLKECGLLGTVSREFCNVLRTVYESDYKRAESYRQTKDIVGCMLAEADFPYALLKGAYLVSLYPKGLRSSNDIDILIEPGNISALERILKKNGFEQGHLKSGIFSSASRAEIISARMNRGETVPFVKKMELPGLNYCEIDINFSLEGTADRKTDVVSAMLKECQKPETETGYTLSRPDFFIHLCVHLYKEATVINWMRMGRDLSLYKFLDLYFLIEKWMNPEFYRKLKGKIFQYEMQKECYYALHYMQELFPCNNMLLEKLLEEIKPCDIGYLREVEDIAKAEKYFYEMEFTDWFFCANREERLRLLP